MKLLPKLGWPRATVGIIAVLTLPLAVFSVDSANLAAAIGALGGIVVPVVYAVMQKDDPPHDQS